MDKFLLLVATKIFGISEDEAKKQFFTGEGAESKVKDDAAQIFLGLHEARMAQNRQKVTEAFDAGAKDREKKLMTKIEGDLRKHFTGDKYEDILAAIDQMMTEDPGGKKRKKGDPITDDDIRTHPLYLGLEGKLKKEYIPLTEHEKVKTELDNRIKSEERGKINSEVVGHALRYLDGLKPGFAFSQNPSVRENQRKTITDMLIGKFDGIVKEGDRIIMTKDGKRVEDAHGNPLKIEDLTLEVTGSLLDRLTQEPKPGSGGAGSGGGAGEPKKYIGKIPVSMDEAKRMAKEITDPKEQEAMWNAFFDAHGK